VKKIIKSVKVMLIPNNKQRTKLLQYSGTSRFAYNWALARQKENYENGGKFIVCSNEKIYMNIKPNVERTVVGYCKANVLIKLENELKN